MRKRIQSKYLVKERRALCWCAAALLATAILLQPVSVWANDGRFEVINASSRQEEAVWLVDARLDLELSDEAANALENGVTLRIKYQYEVTRRRRFWVDEVITRAEQQFELRYLSLSRRYIVRSLGDDTQNSYATQFSALRYLGQVRDFQLVDDVFKGRSDKYEISMRVVLDRENLPGPLAVLAFWRGDFSLESEWYRWRLSN